MSVHACFLSAVVRQQSTATEAQSFRSHRIQRIRVRYPRQRSKRTLQLPDLVSNRNVSFLPRLLSPQGQRVGCPGIDLRQCQVIVSYNDSTPLHSRAFTFKHQFSRPHCTSNLSRYCCITQIPFNSRALFHSRFLPSIALEIGLIGGQLCDRSPTSLAPEWSCVGLQSAVLSSEQTRQLQRSLTRECFIFV